MGLKPDLTPEQLEFLLQQLPGLLRPGGMLAQGLLSAPQKPEALKNINGTMGILKDNPYPIRGGKPAHPFAGFGAVRG